jgi:hypothetical protein
LRFLVRYFLASEPSSMNGCKYGVRNEESPQRIN